jgi:septal ring factor EnvC (AmiA/AmiB activator)
MATEISSEGEAKFGGRWRFKGSILAVLIVGQLGPGLAAAEEARLRAQIAQLKQLADQQAGELDTLGIARLQLSQDRKQLNATLTKISNQRDELANMLAAAQQDKAMLEVKVAGAQRNLGVAEQALATTRQARDRVQQE